MRKSSDQKAFFQAVVPAVLSFALSGVYAIADGFFVGNSLGDKGLSAINLAYPIAAVLQALGTGVGMGGAIHHAIHHAQKEHARAKEFVAGTFWLLFFASAMLTASLSLFNRPLFTWLGASGDILALGEAYIAVIALGAGLQIIGVGLVPMIRNHGGSFYAMCCMVAGFLTNIALDSLLVWALGYGVAGAAWATLAGQAVTLVMAGGYLLRKGLCTLRLPFDKMGAIASAILRIGFAPFALAMAPNFCLMIVNRFSASYGGTQAIAVYACIAYALCILDLILQGVGDGSQPLISQAYGERDAARLQRVRALAYRFAVCLSMVGCAVLYAARGGLGALFGASDEASAEIAGILPIFLVAIPFVAVNRVTTASFYATDKSALSYTLTLMEPLGMLALMLVLPPLCGGQRMIWWSTALARIGAALLACALKRRADKRGLWMQ